MRKDRAYPHERVYKSLWHLALIGVGVYEFRTHRTKLAKVLSAGIILFHLDATVSDALDLEKCMSRRLLEYILETYDTRNRPQSSRYKPFKKPSFEIRK